MSMFFIDLNFKDLIEYLKEISISFHSVEEKLSNKITKKYIFSLGYDEINISYRIENISKENSEELPHTLQMIIYVFPKSEKVSDIKIPLSAQYDIFEIITTPVKVCFRNLKELKTVLISGILQLRGKTFKIIEEIRKELTDQGWKDVRCLIFELSS